VLNYFAPQNDGAWVQGYPLCVGDDQKQLNRFADSVSVSRHNSLSSYQSGLWHLWWRNCWDDEESENNKEKNSNRCSPSQPSEQGI
jgi:hypothetical protein